MISYLRVLHKGSEFQPKKSTLLNPFLFLPGCFSSLTKYWRRNALQNTRRNALLLHVRANKEIQINADILNSGGGTRGELEGALVPL